MKRSVSTVGASSLAVFALVGAAGGGSPTHNGKVVIDCDGAARFGPPSPHWGQCSITGAISDHGSFVDSAVLCVTPHVRVLSARNGTIRIQVYRRRGNWVILGGTRAYAGLRGRGWESNSGRCRGAGPTPITIKMVGTVSQ